MRWGVKQSKWFTTVSQRATHGSYTVWPNWRVLSESVTELRGLSDSEWVTDCHSTVSQQSRAEQWVMWVMVWFKLYIPSNQTVKPCKSYEYLLFRIHFICLEILRLVWWEGKQLSDWNSCLQFFSLTSWDENGWWLGRKVTSPEKRVIPQHTRLTCLAVAILNKYGLCNKSRDFILSKLLS